MNTYTSRYWQKFQREPFDYYATPPEAIKALLAVESFDGSIWEPACGEGAISTVLEAEGYHVISTDLIDRSFGQGGINFLNETVPRAKHIITNPPYGYGLADRFIQKALQFTQKTGGTVAMLCDLSSLCHPDRHDLFIKTPPSDIYALDRIQCLPGGRPPQFKTCKQRYCWMVWKPNHSGETKFHWLAATWYR